MLAWKNPPSKKQKQKFAQNLYLQKFEPKQVDFWSLIAVAARCLTTWRAAASRSACALTTTTHAGSEETTM